MSQLRVFHVLLVIFIITSIFLLIPLYSEEELIGEFLEWTAKSPASKPDQIRVDPIKPDIVWLTQPGQRQITRFNTKTKIMTEFKVPKPYSPDGLVIDSSGKLWFGEQGAGTLGLFDPNYEQFVHFRLPYEKAFPAIPTIDKGGNIWVSDHPNDKVVRYSPKTNEYLIFKLPTKNSWPVDIKADSQNHIWFACYESNKIGVIDLNNKILKEYSLPGKNLGPSFFVFDQQENIWITLWNSNGIIKFNIKTELFTKYELPVNKPGPSAIGISSDGIIYFSTHFHNSIIRVDPKNDTVFQAFQVPTANAGQKDGLEVDNQGLIWFTEFEKNKLGRLKITPVSEMIFSEDGQQNRTIVTPNILKINKISYPKGKIEDHILVY